MFYRTTLRVCVCLAFSPCLSFAQSKPSNDQIVSTVRKTYGNAVELAATAAVGLGQLRIWIDRVEVLRFGAFNSQEKYWPVEVCVVGRAQNASLGLINRGQAPIERISAKVRYRFQVNDFNEWIAAELPPPSNVTAALLNCHTSPERPNTNATFSTVTEAIAKGDYAAANQILEKGTSRKDMESALLLGANHGRLGLVTQLLAKEVNINTRDINGFTPLLNAVIAGQQEVTHELIKRGADINAQDKNGNTALHLSLGTERLQLVQLILNAGANPNLKNAKGLSVLTEAKAKLKRLDVLDEKVPGRRQLTQETRTALQSIIASLEAKGAKD